jgi:hypothetical protein
MAKGKVSKKLVGKSPEAAAKKATKAAVKAQGQSPRQFKTSAKSPRFSPMDIISKTGIMTSQEWDQYSREKGLDTHGAQMAAAEKIGRMVHKSRQPDVSPEGRARGYDKESAIDGKSTISRQLSSWAKSNPNREYQAQRTYNKAAKAKREGTTGLSPTKQYGPYTSVSDWRGDMPQGGGRGVAAPRREWIAWGTAKPNFQQEALNRSRGRNPFTGKADDSKEQTA